MQIQRYPGGLTGHGENMNLQTIQQEFPIEVMLQVSTAIEAAVRASFVSHKMRTLTNAEVKRRASWCCNTAVELRKVKQWPAERICDSMTHALATYLTHGSWDPPERNIW